MFQTVSKAKAIPSALLEGFRSIVGEGNVSTADAVREHHGHDESYFP